MAIQTMFKTRRNFHLQFLNTCTIGPTRDSQCMLRNYQGLLLNLAIIQGSEQKKMTSMIGNEGVEIIPKIHQGSV